MIKPALDADDAHELWMEPKAQASKDAINGLDEAAVILGAALDGREHVRKLHYSVEAPRYRSAGVTTGSGRLGAAFELGAVALAFDWRSLV